MAAGNPKINADIDFLIVTVPNTLWITRLFVVVYLKTKGLYKNTICPNIFLDSNHLEIKEKNLYTAHEILQTKCLFDKGNFYQQFVLANKWTIKYLPNAYTRCCAELVSASFKTEDFWTRSRNILPGGRQEFGMTVLLPIEFLCFVFQYFYQKPRQSNEKVSWGFAFFHPNRLTEKILAKYRQKLSKLGIMEFDET